jgi:hypothetical protein
MRILLILAKNHGTRCQLKSGQIRPTRIRPGQARFLVGQNAGGRYALGRCLATARVSFLGNEPRRPFHDLFLSTFTHLQELVTKQTADAVNQVQRGWGLLLNRRRF